MIGRKLTLVSVVLISVAVAPNIGRANDGLSDICSVIALEQEAVEFSVGGGSVARLAEIRAKIEFMKERISRSTREMKEKIERTKVSGACVSTNYGQRVFQ